MRSLDDFYKLTERAEEMLGVCGVPYKRNTAFSVNNRLKSTFGRCMRHRLVAANVVKFTIDIAGFLMDERFPDEMVLDTIIHELIHTVDGCYSHGSDFKRMAMIVNKKFGCHVEVYTTSEENNVYNSVVGSNDKEYRVKCEKCGHVYSRKTRCKVIAHPERFKCGMCRGDLVRIA